MALPDPKPLDIVADGVPFVRVDLTGLSDNLDIVADGIPWLGYQAIAGAPALVSSVVSTATSQALAATIGGKALVTTTVGTATARALVSQTDTGWIYPGTVVDDASVGTREWSDPTNAAADDGNNAVSIIGISYTEAGYGAQLVVSGTPTGDKKTSTLDTVLRQGQYGGQFDDWGCTLTPTVVNSSNFGVAYQSVGMGGVSHRLKATNFSFAIPSHARIDGVLVEIERQITGTGPYYNNVDYIKMRVYYTELEWVDGLVEAVASVATATAPAPTVGGKAGVIIDVSLATARAWTPNTLGGLVQAVVSTANAVSLAPTVKGKAWVNSISQAISTALMNSPQLTFPTTVVLEVATALAEMLVYDSSNVPSMPQGETKSVRIFIPDQPRRAAIKNFGQVVKPSIDHDARSAFTNPRNTLLADGTYVISAKITPTGNDGTITVLNGNIVNISPAT